MQTDNAIDRVRSSTNTFLDQVHLGNTTRNWLLAVAVLVVILAALVTARWLIVRRLGRNATKSRTQVDDFLVALLDDTRYSFLFVVALTGALKVLVLPTRISELVMPIARLAVIFQVGLWANQLITLSLQRITDRRVVRDVASVTTVHALGLAGRFVLWTMIVLIMLRSFGVNVTALVGGLGIAGVAIALAVQNILGDIFASLSIVLDKPFVVGDFIAVGDFLGTVEEIGLKTTRVRSLGGERLVFSNADLLTSRIRNYRDMKQRRVVFSFGVEYGTPGPVLVQIADAVKETITSIEQTRFDRSHFQKFGDSSLDFEVVYYVLVPDYNVYMDIQQRINLALYEKVTALGTSFAFPTRTMVLDPSVLERFAPESDGQPAATARGAQEAREAREAREAANG